MCVDPQDPGSPNRGFLHRFVFLLKEDATYTMPPLPQWYAGRAAIRTFFGWAWRSYGGFRLVATAANRQPAFAAYSRMTADAPWTAHSIHVLSLDQDAISSLTLFAKPTGPQLFDAFGLPLIIPDTSSIASLSTPHHS
jgi:RNA polymerase sigma-70 factor, ECF subfamily